MTAFNLGDHWQRLYVPAPPARPGCEGASPLLFEFVPQELATLSRRADGKPLPVALNAQLDVALRYCAECPLAVRDWCENRAVLPRQSRSSIIAGGKVFSRGRVVWDIDRQRAATKAAERAA